MWVLGGQQGRDVIETQLASGPALTMISRSSMVTLRVIWRSGPVTSLMTSMHASSSFSGLSCCTTPLVDPILTKRADEVGGGGGREEL
ncbi:hypothetical protein BHM03_00029758 [Ensete ventricosum]|nr:hypothetical protein BHM03_00029758 [Ensete ventricosum]